MPPDADPESRPERYDIRATRDRRNDKAPKAEYVPPPSTAKSRFAAPGSLGGPALGTTTRNGPVLTPKHGWGRR